MQSPMTCCLGALAEDEQIPFSQLDTVSGGTAELVSLPVVITRTLTPEWFRD